MWKVKVLVRQIVGSNDIGVIIAIEFNDVS